MRYITIITAMILSLNVFAASDRVYKRLNEDGVVEYSDTPGDDAKVIKVPKSSTYSTPQTPAAKSPASGNQTADEEKPITYELLEIISPKDDEPIRSNPGNMTADARVVPNLSGYHRLSWSLDNKVIEGSNSLVLKLTNLDRGTHTLKIMITDDKGKEILASEPITFHMLRVSH